MGYNIRGDLEMTGATSLVATPKRDGFHMPAEWHKHEKTWMSWPVKASMVHPDNYKEFSDGFQEIIGSIAAFEPVTVLVNKAAYDEVTERLGWYMEHSAYSIDIVIVEHDDAWIRDNGPTYVINPDTCERRGIDWGFNAWGGKYTPYEKDAAVAKQLLHLEKNSHYVAPLILEGGSIHVDGQKTLLTTKECLLNPNRNPNLTQKEIESYMYEYLNIEQILWLDQGLYGDETDGHIDNIACFANPSTILIQTTNDPKHPDYEISQRNLDVLSHATNINGQTYEIIQIESPPVRYYKGQPLTLSYLNFYLVNSGLILPVFGGDATQTDHKAVATLQDVFPDREIVKIDGMRIIKEGGNVHCITQQMPRK